MKYTRAIRGFGIHGGKGHITIGFVPPTRTILLREMPTGLGAITAAILLYSRLRQIPDA